MYLTMYIESKILLVFLDADNKTKILYNKIQSKICNTF